MLIIRRRLLDESGWSIVGGLDTWGSAWAWVSFSWTLERASYRLVPAAKTMTMRESPGIDSDRMTSTS